MDRLLHIIGRDQAAVLQLVPVLGVGDQAQLLSLVRLLQAVDVVVILRLIGQQGAVGNALQFQFDELDAVLQRLQLLLSLEIVVQIVDQLFEAVAVGADIVLIFAVGRLFIVGEQLVHVGLLVAVSGIGAVALLIFHKDDHVVQALVERPRLAVCGLLSLAGLIHIFARLIAAPADGLHPVAGIGGHTDSHLSLVVRVVNLDLHTAMRLGVVVQRRGMIAGNDLLERLFQFFLRALLDEFLADQRCDLGQDLIKQRLEYLILGLTDLGLIRFALVLRGYGVVLDLFQSGGLHQHIAAGADHGVLAQLGLHVLQRDGDRNVAAGMAVMQYTLIGHRLCGHVALGGHMHVALVGDHRAVHGGVRVVDQHGRGQRQRRPAQARIRVAVGLDLGP